MYAVYCLGMVISIACTEKLFKVLKIMIHFPSSEQIQNLGFLHYCVNHANYAIHDYASFVIVIFFKPMLQQDRNIEMNCSKGICLVRQQCYVTNNLEIYALTQFLKTQKWHNLPKNDSGLVYYGNRVVGQHATCSRVKYAINAGYAMPRQTVVWHRVKA